MIVLYILSILLVSIVAYMWGIYDAKVVIYNHVSRFVLRFSTGLLLSVGINLVNVQYFVIPADYNVFITVSIILYLCNIGLVFMLIFELSYNMHKGNSFEYIGTTANTDRLLRAINIDGKLYFTMKIVATFIFSVMYIGWITYKD